MTQSSIRMHPTPSAKPASQKSNPAKAHQPQPQQQVKAASSNPSKPNPDARKIGHPSAGTTMNADATPGPEAQTPSDVVTNAAAKAKDGKTGMFANMRTAAAPYLEKHSHTVLYGIVGFIAAALILIVGFWPTVLLAVFAAVGVIIGRYRDGDQKTRAHMKSILERISS